MIGDRYVVQRLDDDRFWHGGDRWGGIAAALWFASMREAQGRAEREVIGISYKVGRLNADANQVTK